jgi:hypothetical protein
MKILERLLMTAACIAALIYAAAQFGWMRQVFGL